MLLKLLVLLPTFLTTESIRCGAGIDIDTQLLLPQELTHYLGMHSIQCFGSFCQQFTSDNNILKAIIGTCNNMWPKCQNTNDVFNVTLDPKAIYINITNDTSVPELIENTAAINGTITCCATDNCNCSPKGCKNESTHLVTTTPATDQVVTNNGSQLVIRYAILIVLAVLMMCHQ